MVLSLFAALLSITLTPLGPGTQSDGLHDARLTRPENTWVEVDGRRFGAEPDALGPLGGGAGYVDRPEGPAVVVDSIDELVAALGEAQPGDVVRIPGELELDLTARVLVDGLVLELPGGVTLAGDRGREGSGGALLRSDAFQTRPLIRVTGPGARVHGLRLQGPDPERRLDHHRRAFREGRGREYYYRFPVSDGIETEHDGLRVDGCELAGWSHAAIYLKAGKAHRVDHCWIHHNQYQGLGYGVCHDVAESVIERNLFDWNRHSIAGTGRPGSGYAARHNVELGESLSHCFDMHGGRDRGDGTDVAGTWMRFERNTFLCPKRAIKIRGVPVEGALVEGNWFVHPDLGTAVQSDGNTRLGANAVGRERIEVVGG